MPNKTLAENKEILRTSVIIEHWEAGIKLTGPEVKAAKQQSVSLTGSYVSFVHSAKGQISAWLIGCHIGAYRKAGYSQLHYLPKRQRQLLLNAREINEMYGKSRQKGLTITPVSMYTARGFVKLNVALCRGQRKFDKRETIKRREFEKTKRRLLKSSIH